MGNFLNLLEMSWIFGICPEFVGNVLDFGECSMFMEIYEKRPEFVGNVLDL